MRNDWRRIYAGLALPVVLMTASACITPTSGVADDVLVEIREGIPEKRSWEFERPSVADTYHAPAFGLFGLPDKYSAHGVIADRKAPYHVIARSTVKVEPGEYRLLLRSHNAARLWIDGELLAETDFLVANASSHEELPEIERVAESGMPPLPVGHQEVFVNFEFAEASHEIVVETVVGGKNLRPGFRELVVAIGREGEPLQLLASDPVVLFTQKHWLDYTQAASERIVATNERARREAVDRQRDYWNTRHELARQAIAKQPAIEIPTAARRSMVNNGIDEFIGTRLAERGISPAPLSDDYSFVRRVYLDTVGVVPTPEEIREFLADDADRTTARSRLITKLLRDQRWADNWVGYWQDVLAENPALLKPKLNNTGPFRWWIHESFVDNKPMDQFATELVLMEGSVYFGGPAGFSMATENDVPMAAKAHVIAKAFLGVELKCARCHDAPYHPFRQEQLFSLGAMLAKEPLEVPKSSTVDLAGRTRIPAVDITLEAGSSVDPSWPFHELAPVAVSTDILRDPENPRERLAAILTSPNNSRFAEVLVNRLWKRYLGFGIVEPVDDWSAAEPSHPQLLKYLANELINHNYDWKHVASLIFHSNTYQRAVVPGQSGYQEPQNRLFASPARRRLRAEQVVDSLFAVAGKEFRTEELCLDPEGRRPVTQFVNLGTPTRAWQFTSLSNDRDRPSLSLPFAQNIVDVLIALGWRESRQEPTTVREETPTILQPMVLAHGVVGRRISTLSDDSALTEISLKDQSLSELLEEVFLRILSRPPTAEESALFASLLSGDYESRRIPGAKKTLPEPLEVTGISWANHFDPDSVRLKIELADVARAGDPPTARLKTDWRERMEDMVWSLLQSPEFMFIP